MAEIRTVTTLESKRTEIRNAIVQYERLLEQARADLAHVTAAIRLFEVPDDPARAPAYADIHRLYKHRELVTLCKRAIAERGPQDTRQLAAYALEAKGLSGGDKVLAKAVAGRVIHSMRMQHARGGMADGGRRSGVRIWRLPTKA